MAESEHHSLSLFLIFLSVVVLLNMTSAVKEFMQHFYKQSKEKFWCYKYIIIWGVYL